MDRNDSIKRYRYRNVIGATCLVTTGKYKGQERLIKYLLKDNLFFETDNPRIKKDKKTQQTIEIHDKTHLSNVRIIHEGDRYTLSRFIRIKKHARENS